MSKLRWGVAGLAMLSVGVLAIPASAASRSVFKARGKELSAVVTTCPDHAPVGTQCEAWLVDPELGRSAPAFACGLRRGNLLPLRERRLVGPGGLEPPTKRL